MVSCTGITKADGHLDTALFVCNEPVCYDPFFLLFAITDSQNSFSVLYVCHNSRNAGRLEWGQFSPITLRTFAGLLKAH